MHFMSMNLPPKFCVTGQFDVCWTRRISVAAQRYKPRKWLFLAEVGSRSHAKEEPYGCWHSRHRRCRLCRLQSCKRPACRGTECHGLRRTAATGGRSEHRLAAEPSAELS